MSELSVGQLKGLPINNNVVTVPAGQTLYAPGHVIQTIHGTTTTGVTNNSTSQVDTGLIATITPKFTSSKILVLVSQSIWKSSGNAENQATVYLHRNSTQISTLHNFFLASGPTAINLQGSLSINYLDSPSSTSSLTYKTTFSNYVASSSIVAQQYGSLSAITLMEIAA